MTRLRRLYRYRWHLPWLVAAIVMVSALAAPAATPAAGTIAEGTRFATPYYVRQAELDGPTVMITGGIHGDEPAGTYAADQIRHWPIVRGRLIVLPRANVPALKGNSRHTPDAEDRELRNLNRNFSRAGEFAPPRGTPAEEIWQLLKQQKPDWLVDLHEGSDFRQTNPERVGNSIIVHPTPATQQAAPLMLAAVHATVDDQEKQFVQLNLPVDGSLARAAGEHLGMHAMILETTSRGQPLSRRARQHRTMVHRLLAHLAMIGPEVTVDWITDQENHSDRIRVALYDAGGTEGKGVPRLLQLLDDWPNTSVVRVGPADVRGGALSQFRVVVFSGGTGSGQARALGELGREKLTQFVASGGGYVGICAGAYLASNGFSWALNILDAKTVSPKWRRGRGTVQMELTDEGREFFGDQDGPLGVRYHNGPILMPAGSDSLPDYRSLALFRTELAEHGAPEGVMVDSPAIVAGRFAEGRVVCFSPHPEQTDGLDHLVHRAVEWAANQDD